MVQRRYSGTSLLSPYPIPCSQRGPASLPIITGRQPPSKQSLAATHCHPHPTLCGVKSSRSFYIPSRFVRVPGPGWLVLKRDTAESLLNPFSLLQGPAEEPAAPSPFQLFPPAFLSSPVAERKVHAFYELRCYLVPEAAM